MKSNPKYAHVQSNLDTGASRTKFEAKMKEKAAIAPKRGELFRRITPASFMRLCQQDLMMSMEVSARASDAGAHDLAETTGDERFTLDEDEAEAQAQDGEAVRAAVPPRPTDSKRRPYLAAEEDPLLARDELAADRPAIPRRKRAPAPASVSGRGAHMNAILTGDFADNEAPAAPAAEDRGGASTLASLAPSSPVSSFLVGGLPEYENRYLLVDVRTQDEFDACHIDGAESFPAARLARSVNVFTPSMLKYKNRPNAIIIVYDGDEKVATRAANGLFQQGFDNVCLLSGGLKLFAASFADHVIGELPAELRPAPSEKERRAASRQSSSSLAGAPVSPNESMRSDALSSVRSQSMRSTASTQSRMSDISKLPGLNARTKGAISAWH